MRNINNMANICADLLIEIALRDNAQTPNEARKNIREWLKAYTENTQLGAMLFNTNYHVSYIPTKVWDMAWEKLDGYKPTYEEYVDDDWHREYVKANELGIEPYSIAIEETKKTGAEVWFSIRMNEFHYMARWPKTDAATLWIERPDLRMAEDKPFNYEYKEVRDYYLIYIKDLCENWDIDGIELDFWRGPDFFNAPITQEKTQIITDFVKEIRGEVDKIAKKKNKKIMISARTDVHPDAALEKGWDSAGWIADGSVDILTLSDFFVPSNCEMNVEEWIKRISEKGVKREDYGINVCTDLAQFCILYNMPEVKWLLTNTEFLKGFASLYYDKGVDGIYTFNICNRDYLLPMEERVVNFGIFLDKEKVKQGIRQHILVYNGTEQKYKMYDKYLKAEAEDGETVKLKLDTSKMPQKGSYIIQVGTNQENAELEVYINGIKCKYIGNPEGTDYGVTEGLNVKEMSEVAKCVTLYELEDIKAACDGINDFSITNKSGEKIELVWFSVQVDSK